MGRAMKIPFSGIIIIWCSVMSFACFMAMGIDKLKARAKKWRIPERTLFRLAAMGGALGGIFGMLAFRHKTKHKSFVIGMPLLLLLNIVCIASVICLAMCG